VTTLQRLKIEVDAAKAEQRALTKRGAAVTSAIRRGEAEAIVLQRVDSGVPIERKEAEMRVAAAAEQTRLVGKALEAARAAAAEAGAATEEEIAARTTAEAAAARTARAARSLSEVRRERGDLSLLRGVKASAVEAAARGWPPLEVLLDRGHDAVGEAAALLASLRGGRCWALPEASNDAMRRLHDALGAQAALWHAQADSLALMREGLHLLRRADELRAARLGWPRRGSSDDAASTEPWHDASEGVVGDGGGKAGVGGKAGSWSPLVKGSDGRRSASPSLPRSPGSPGSPSRAKPLFELRLRSDGVPTAAHTSEAVLRAIAAQGAQLEPLAQLVTTLHGDALQQRQIAADAHRAQLAAGAELAALADQLRRLEEQLRAAETAVRQASRAEEDARAMAEMAEAEAAAAKAEREAERERSGAGVAAAHAEPSGHAGAGAVSS